MKTSKNILNDTMKVYSSNKRQSKRNTSSLNQVSLFFMEGRSIGDLSYDEEDGETRRKVRRIIEKRVCQKLHNTASSLEGNGMRFRERRQSAKQVKRICGRIPYAYSA